MSPAWAAPPLVMPADMRFVTICPGEIPPNTSCVTFPTPPIGLISVSPSDRAATAASTAESAIATRVSYHMNVEHDAGNHDRDEQSRLQGRRSTNYWESARGRRPNLPCRWV